MDVPISDLAIQILDNEKAREILQDKLSESPDSGTDNSEQGGRTDNSEQGCD